MGRRLFINRQALQLVALSSILISQVANTQKMEIFKPDRAYFYETCGSITNFFQKEKNGPAFVAARKTAITPEMRENIESFFDYWEKVGDSDKRKLAYILATAYRESQESFKPIREAENHCKLDEVCREKSIEKVLKDKTPEGKHVPHNYALPEPNGKRYYGRGYVQLTFGTNYKRVGKKLGMGDRLYENPDDVLQPEIAVKILMNGMIEGGYFGKTRLSDYFDGLREEWECARRIVNPGSSNKAITADLGKEFRNCLRESA
jgi:hypothetical protein